MHVSGSRLDQSPIDSREASHSPWWVISCGFNSLSLFIPTWNCDPTWLSSCSGWNKNETTNRSFSWKASNWAGHYSNPLQVDEVDEPDELGWCSENPRWIPAVIQCSMLVNAPAKTWRYPSHRTPSRPSLVSDSQNYIEPSFLVECPFHKAIDRLRHFNSAGILS